MKRFIFILILFVFTSLEGHSQIRKYNDGPFIARAVILDGDTVPVFDLPVVRILGPRIFKSKIEAIRYSKLIRDVKRVYPYAKLSGIKFRKYNSMLLNVSNEKEKKRLMKQAENELREEFEDDIRKLTMKQGIILIKLIDRETGNTSFEIVKELRGTFTAFFWQQIGRIFGISLKIEYLPETRDKYIEEIVVMIENGTV